MGVWQEWTQEQLWVWISFRCVPQRILHSARIWVWQPRRFRACQGIDDGSGDNHCADYHSGIMTGVPTECNLNHAILATGYGPNFWKIKNSWGAQWGDAGFAKFERSTSGCGPFGIFFQDAGFQPKLASYNLLV